MSIRNITIPHHNRWSPWFLDHPGLDTLWASYTFIIFKISIITILQQMIAPSQWWPSSQPFHIIITLESKIYTSRPPSSILIIVISYFITTILHQNHGHHPCGSSSRPARAQTNWLQSKETKPRNISLTLSNRYHFVLVNVNIFIVIIMSKWNW